MNSVTHNVAEEGDLRTAVEGGGIDRFFADMAEGLHAMAQPLTILRSSVLSLAAPELTAGHRDRYTQISVQQVERACELFDCLQDLLIANQVAPICYPFELSHLFDAITEHRRTKVDGLGVKLKFVAPEGMQPIFGDFSRTLQALLAALKIADAVSSPGDSVALQAAAREGQMELTVSNRLAHRRTLNSSERLRLALAEANVRSQRGSFEFAEDPFRVMIALPMQDVSPLVETAHPVNAYGHPFD
jgi:hypothetical protein